VRQRLRGVTPVSQRASEAQFQRSSTSPGGFCRGGVLGQLFLGAADGAALPDGAALAEADVARAVPGRTEGAALRGAGGFAVAEGRGAGGFAVAEGCAAGGFAVAEGCAAAPVPSLSPWTRVSDTPTITANRSAAPPASSSVPRRRGCTAV